MCLWPRTFECGILRHTPGISENAIYFDIVREKTALELRLDDPFLSHSMSKSWRRRQEQQQQRIFSNSSFRSSSSARLTFPFSRAIVKGRRPRLLKKELSLKTWSFLAHWVQATPLGKWAFNHTCYVQKFSLCIADFSPVFQESHFAILFSHKRPSFLALGLGSGLALLQLQFRRISPHTF